MFLKEYEATGLIRRQVGFGHPSKVTAEIKEIVERQMRSDDKTTAHQLHCLLAEKSYSISLCTILCCRTTVGGMFRGNAYCQLMTPCACARGKAIGFVCHLSVSSSLKLPDCRI